MIRTLSELSGNNWTNFWTVSGGDEACDHAYEEFDPLEEDEYTAVYICTKCGARLDYDVSDIGD